MTKYIAYYRVSTDKQGRSGLGLEAQQAAVKTFLDGKGWPPFREFTEVESGKKADRPELDRALTACRLHKATLVTKLDRLARDASFLLRLIDEQQVDVVFYDMPDIPAGAAGRFILTQMAAVAELEAGLTSERTKAALAAAKERGVKLGGFRGYKPSDDDRAKAVAVKKAKAQKHAEVVLPEIEAIQAEGITSLGGIAKALNEREVPTARGGQWQAVQVKRVLAQL